MNKPFTTIMPLAACFLMGISRLPAGTEINDSLTPTVAPPSSIPISQEFTADGSYSGGAKTKQGDASIGNVDNTHAHFNYVVSPQVKEGTLLRFGFDAERDSFGLPQNAALPNTLQSINAIIGADIAVSDKILVRAELHPGIYSDFVDVTSSDFDMPVQIGGTYLYSKDLQFILGFQIDLKSEIPFIGLPGFRWQIADKWVLSAIPPKPQLQYELNKAVTLYVGAEIIGGTYHLNDQFGNNHSSVQGPNHSSLNGDIADFNEDRVGAGVTWKFTPNLSLDLSGGYIAYRQFDLHPDHIGFDMHSTSFHNNIGDGAPYGEMGISGSF
jgi:hypothetical protein